jgi:hypothetical protein
MSDNAPLYLAMWSGPRNISTAMLRSFGSRTDTFVCDEPLYAHYLKATGLPHPGAAEIIAHDESDWRKVADWLTGPVPEGKSIFYQKLMTHHLLPVIDRDWLERLTYCFLIRDPREVLTSYLNIEELAEPSLEDLGFPQQQEIFEMVRERTGQTPVVLDSKDVLDNPAGILARLCEVLGIEFTDAMLTWPPGPRATDGVWAKHWYSAVEKSTGFQPFRPKPDQVPEHLQSLYEQCLEYYDRLYEKRLTVEA